MIIMTSSFSKTELRFQNVFRPYRKAKSLFSNFFGVKIVFEKLHFCDGLVLTVGSLRTYYGNAEDNVD